MTSPSRVFAALASIALSVTLTPTLSAQAAELAKARVVPISGPFAPLTLRKVLEIPESSINADRISMVSASPNGTIIVVDGKGGHIIAFSPTGTRLREVGHKGDGPGEFRTVNAVAWLHDTLAILDTRLRRVGLFSVETGKGLASFPWPEHTQIYRGDLQNAGTSVFAVVPLSDGPPVKGALGAMEQAPSVFHYAPFTGHGFGASLDRFRDSTEPGVPGYDCMDKGNSIQILSPFFPDRGPVRALAPTGELIDAVTDSFALLIRPRDPAQRNTLLVRAGMRLPLTNPIWDSVAKEYKNLDRLYHLTVCSSPVTRPAMMPVIRGIHTDDKGRVWVETTMAKGGGLLNGISITGTPFGATPLPVRDEAVRWFIRGDRLYLVVADADDLQSVRVYTIMK